MPRGGKREGAGRKPRAEEDLLIEKLDAVINQAEVIEVLKRKIKEGSDRALTLYMNYRYGKPKETVNASHTFNNFSISDVMKFKD